jgi:hypothetical protein
MSDDTHRMFNDGFAPPGDSREEQALGAALRALPTILPPVSALPLLHAHWAKQRSPSAWRQPQRWAIAAGLAAISLGVLIYRNSAHETIVPAVTHAPSNIERLMAQSADWERALQRFDQQSIPIDAGSALASAELEDLIGLTDLQLGATETDTEAESLWQRRVSLMSRLAEVRTQSAWQRGSSEQNPMLLAATYPIN